MSQLRRLDVLRARKLNRESSNEYLEACKTAKTREVLSRVISNFERHEEKYPLIKEIIRAIVQEQQVPFAGVFASGAPRYRSRAEEEQAQRCTKIMADQDARFAEDCRRNSQISILTKLDFFGGSIEGREKILADAEDFTTTPPLPTTEGRFEKGISKPGGEELWKLLERQ